MVEVDYKNDELVYRKMQWLVETLNRYADSYYNGESIVTDEEYDHLYNMLEEMEKQKEEELKAMAAFMPPPPPAYEPPPAEKGADGENRRFPQ